VQKYHVILVDFLDVVAHPLAGLVQSLRVVDHRGFKVSAVVVVPVQLADVLVGECLVVEGDGILVGAVPSDGLVEQGALVGVGVVVGVVVFLRSQVGLELPKKELAFTLKFLLLGQGVISADAGQVQDINFRRLLKLH
jgi:hypothetical protein